jgi:ribosome-binding factor A
VRLTPSLEFVLDALPDNAGRIDDLLARAREEDARLASERDGKGFAGESNPYRDSDDEQE